MLRTQYNVDEYNTADVYCNIAHRHRRDIDMLTKSVYRINKVGAFSKV